MQADCGSAEGHHNTEQLGNKLKDKFCSMKVIRLGKNLHHLYVHRLYTFPAMDSKRAITVQEEDCGGIVSISMKTSAKYPETVKNKNQLLGLTMKEN